MKPSLYLVKEPIVAQKGDYILVVNDQVVYVVPNPQKSPSIEVKEESKNDHILDSILGVIRSKGRCTTRFISDSLGIARNDEIRRAEIIAHVKHLLLAGKIKKCENSSRLGPYEIV